MRAKRFAQRKLKKHFGARVNSVQDMADEDFLRLFDFEINGGRFDSSSTSAMSSLMQHFADRVANESPAQIEYLTDLRIEPSKMAPDVLIDRADRALRGELHPSGLKPKMLPGSKIDWSANPSASREWLLMLHRHAWWPLWGEAYKLTGNEDYAAAFVQQLEDWIDKHPSPQQKSEHITSWRLMEAGLRMRVSWLPAFAYFFESEAFNDRIKMKMLRACFDHGQFLNRFYTNRNHLVRESNGLLALGLYFREWSAAPDWVRNALNRLDAELQTQVNADGSHIEMSTGYQWLTIDEFVTTKRLLDHHKLKFPETDLDDVLGNMIEYLAAVMRPDRSFPQLNDGFILWDADRLAELGRMTGRRDVEYIGSGGASGSMPEYCSKSFPHAGVHVMRSEWKQDGFYSIFDTGPYGGPHGHEDKLSFELFVGGVPFIVDPGSYTYNKKDPYRHYFVGSQGHNTVLVDGGSQIRRWDSRHAEPAVNTSRHGKWQHGTEFDFASGQYDEGYAPFEFTRPDNVSVISDVVHRRDVVFAKSKFWMVIDSLHASIAHNYNFLFHAAPDIIVSSLTETSAVLRSERNGQQMVLQAVTWQQINSELIRGDDSPIQGWFSADHHKKCPAPTLQFEIQNAESALVAWIFYPVAAGEDAAAVQCDLQPMADAREVEFELIFGGSSYAINVEQQAADEEKSSARISIIRDDVVTFSVASDFTVSEQLLGE